MRTNEKQNDITLHSLHSNYSRTADVHVVCSMYRHCYVGYLLSLHRTAAAAAAGIV